MNVPVLELAPRAHHGWGDLHVQNISLLDAGDPDERTSLATDNSYCLASALHSIRNAQAAAADLGIPAAQLSANWTSIVYSLSAA